MNTVRLALTSLSLGLAALLSGCETPAYYDDYGNNYGYYDVGQQGFYGAIDVYGAPPPVLLYPQPVVIGAVVVGAAPLYLYVPLEQTHRWGDYCGFYNACNRSVYFVQQNWYQRQYVPYYRSHVQEYQRRRTEVENFRSGPQRGEVRRDIPSGPPRVQQPPPRQQPDNFRPGQENRRPPPASAPGREERRPQSPPESGRDERRPQSPPESGRDERRFQSPPESGRDERRPQSPPESGREERRPQSPPASGREERRQQPPPAVREERRPQPPPTARPEQRNTAPAARPGASQRKGRDENKDRGNDRDRN